LLLGDGDDDGGGGGVDPYACEMPYITMHERCLYVCVLHNHLFVCR
jgi:hypothetical protein